VSGGRCDWLGKVDVSQREFSARDMTAAILGGCLAVWNLPRKDCARYVLMA
jgi:hypothetical protein